MHFAPLDFTSCPHSAFIERHRLPTAFTPWRSIKSVGIRWKANECTQEWGCAARSPPTSVQQLGCYGETGAYTTPGHCMLTFQKPARHHLLGGAAAASHPPQPSHTPAPRRAPPPQGIQLYPLLPPSTVRNQPLHWSGIAPRQGRLDSSFNGEHHQRQGTCLGLRVYS